MGNKITTFFMFEGNAEEAMNFYTSLFNDSKIASISRYASGEPGKEGTVKHAVFSLCGQQYMAIDSSATHGFTFTPSMSLFVDCDSDQEINTLFERLSDGGKVLMDLDKYPGLKKFGWLSDRFGVSWQLNLK